MHRAIRKDDFKALKILIHRGANLFDRDYDGLNAFHYAAAKGNVDMIKHLFSRVPSPEQLKAFGISEDNHGRNALHHALLSDRREDFKVIQYLLANTGIDVNSQDNTGMPPLATYLSRINLICDPDIVQLLLERGSDPTFATKNGGLGLAHLHASASSWIIIDAINVKTLLIMMKYFVDLGLRDGQGRTMLHHSATSGSLTEDALCFLCSAAVGLSTDTTNAHGKTALDYAKSEAKRPRHENTYKPDRWSRAEGILSALISSRNSTK